MEFSQLNFSREITETLEVIYHEVKKYNPIITKRLFLETLIGEWLENYKVNVNKRPLQRDKVLLKNRLKEALKTSGKTQSEVAKLIGVNRSYFGQIVRGNCDPSVRMSLLVLDAINYPPQKFTDIFYLEPVDQE